MELRCIFFLFRPLLPFICFRKHWIFFSKETLFPFNIHMMRVKNIWKEFKREQLLRLSSCVILNVCRRCTLNFLFHETYDRV